MSKKILNFAMPTDKTNLKKAKIILYNDGN